MPILHAAIRRAIGRADLPDPFTRALYKVAPYQGCAHGCRYCDGRAEKYFVAGDFERDITVRRNIPELFAAELPGLRESGMIVFGSGTTDPYQPCEAEENLTGRCAALLAAHLENGKPDEAACLPFSGETAGAPGGAVRVSAALLTKSALVLRDLPVWKRVHEQGGFLLLMTLAGIDDAVRAHFEPGASPVAERLATLRAFKAAGIPVGVLSMPLLPGINDDVVSLETLYTACLDLGVDFLMPGGLTLRPGRQKDLYLETLAAWDADLAAPTRILYAEDRPSGSPRAHASRAFFSRLAPLRRAAGIPYLLPHRVFRRLLPAHDALRVLFLDMLELYRERGDDVGALGTASKRYDEWLVSLRREFRRRRTLPVAWLPERFAAAFADGEIERVLANPRLAAFARHVVCEGAVLDYRSLRLSC